TQNASFSSTSLDISKRPRVNSTFTDGELKLPHAINPEISIQVNYLGVGKWGNLTYLRYGFSPYNYQNGHLSSISNLSFSIELEATDLDNRIITPGLVENSHNFFINPEMIDEYDLIETRQNNLMVVTTWQIYSAMSNYLTFRTGQGFNIIFGDIDVILNTMPGSTNPEKVRNYLISEYNSAAENYALLVGDFNTIPIQYLNPAPNAVEETPTDFYYTDLTSNFNSDGDQFIGEFSTGFGNEDYEIDFTPEVYVGRIPFSDLGQLDSIFQRIISFEQSQATWKDNVLTPMAMFNFENQDYEDGWERTDGSDYAEYMKNTILRNNQVTTMYEQVGFDHATNPSDMDLNYDNLQNTLNNDNYGFVCLGAHGSPTSSSRLVWDDDYDGNGICTSDERVWSGLINNDMYDNITNQSGNVFYTQSCLNGGFDLTGISLGQKMLLETSVSTITATRTGWYKIGWINPGWGGCHSQGYYFMDNYFTHRQPLGMSLSNANHLFSNYFFFGDPVDTGGIVWPEQKNIYTYTLYGDPLINYVPEHVETEGEILVWEPNGFGSSFEVVNAISEAGNWSVVYSEKISDEYISLDNYEAVFCLFDFGQDPFAIESTSFESQLLSDYIADGGKVYCESRGSFDIDTPFYNYFNIWAPFDHVVDIDYITSSISPMNWDYDGVNGNLQALEIPNQNQFTNNALLAQQDTYYDVIAIKTSTNDAVTVGSSFQLAGVTDRDNTLPELITEILYTNFGLETAQENGDDSQPVINSRLEVYPLPASERVTFKSQHTAPNLALKIYNIRGQLVRTLDMSKSTEVTWDLKDMNGNRAVNGVYFSKLTKGDSKPVKFLILK
ncbi:MAG: C25 family cysteine peptidase, partial [Candidatus Zophobacter franzmannii]|nr:C25 family cysteine peptidase [Candidatus Zophobacter franzmannii]